MKLPRATIVLAHLMSSRGELNPETKARIDLAVNLQSELPSDIILLCGWAYRPDCSMAIADAMKGYILDQSPGLAEKVVCQRLSRDTVGDAIFSRLCLDEVFVGLSSFDLNVVTSDYHSNRAQKIFEFVFGESSLITLKSAPGFSVKTSAIKEMRSLEAFKKTFSDATPGDLTSIYLSLMNNHPFYNGAIYPRVEDMNAATLDVRMSLGSL